MQIGKKDVVWNYTATFFQYGVAMMIFPFILHILSSETVAIWTIFTTITAFVNLLDFGFNPSFMRNVAYVFSGAKELKSSGFHIVEDANTNMDFGLLKGLISAMRFFYSRMAIILCLILVTIGSYYVFTILKDYSGNHSEIYISWTIVCCINSYSFYTLYYDSLLMGKGLVKRIKQIIIIGQITYLFVAIILILSGLGLISIVSAQGLSVIIKRILSYRSFYTREIKDNLQKGEKKSQKDILRAIYPNAIKVGLTSIGGFIVSRSAIIIGSLYLSLKMIASYGVTIQIIGIIAGISTVYYSTYIPKILQYRVQNNSQEIKRLYITASLLLLTTYIICGICLLAFGDWALNLIGSKTVLLNKSLIAIAILIAFLESNHGMAGGVLVTKNEVPYFKAALFAGSLTLVLLFIFLKYANMGILGLLLAPGIAQVSYQNWHWPVVVIKELNIKIIDIRNIGLSYCNRLCKSIKIKYNGSVKGNN